MITDIPSPSEFHATGLSQLHLAWQIAISAVETYDGAGEFLDEVHRVEAFDEYWHKSQPALANAFSLVQQAMEMALKGRIAAISPYLLIARDPRDWPRGSESQDVPFSEFRSLDAADLVKVHNTFSVDALDNDFREFWEGVRRDRNKVMHSVSPKAFEPSTLIRAVLKAARWLFAERSWPRRLIEMEDNGTLAALGVVDYTYNTVLRQVDLAIQQLSPADRRELFGRRTNQRTYLCPNCHQHADREIYDDWPHLAQLRTRRKEETMLDCVVCETSTEVERSPCTQDCRGNVIHLGTCLTCLTSQDNPYNFNSGLADPSLGFGHQYTFTFKKKEDDQSTWDQQMFRDHDAAKEHARLALLAPHLASWNWALVEFDQVFVVGRSHKDRTLGTWVRDGDGLRWEEGRRFDAKMSLI